MTQRFTAAVGLICLAVTAGLCLAAFLTYRRHAQQVMEDNVVAAKGIGLASGPLVLGAFMGNARAAEQAEGAIAQNPLIPLEAPPATRWCLIGAAPFAAGAVACFFILGNLMFVLVAGATGMSRGARDLILRASRAVAAARGELRHRDDRPPSPPTDFNSLPKYPEN